MDQEHLLDLQRSELRRFQDVKEIYEAKTNNPIGLRFSNIERAFTVIAAKQFIGWNSDVSYQDFTTSACSILRDYLTGPYIAYLPEEYRNEILDSSKNEAWFDFVQLGLYVSMKAIDHDTLSKIALWVCPSMQFDSGIEEVSRIVNKFYVGICLLLSSRTSELDKLVEEISRARLDRNERILFAALKSVSSGNYEGLKDALQQFEARWSAPESGGQVNELFSIDFSILVTLFEIQHRSTSNLFSEFSFIR